MKVSNNMRNSSYMLNNQFHIVEFTIGVKISIDFFTHTCIHKWWWIKVWLHFYSFTKSSSWSVSEAHEVYTLSKASNEGFFMTEKWIFGLIINCTDSQMPNTLFISFSCWYFLHFLHLVKGHSTDFTHQFLHHKDYTCGLKNMYYVLHL